MNLGFSDVQALVDTLSHAVECGQDIGDMTLLEVKSLPLLVTAANSSLPASPEDRGIPVPVCKLYDLTFAKLEAALTEKTRQNLLY